LLSAVGFLDEAAGAQQPLKERKGRKQAQIGGSGTFAEGAIKPRPDWMALSPSAHVKPR